MRLKAGPWAELAEGAGTEASRQYLLCAAFAAQSRAMSWTCPRCQLPVYFAEKVSSLGKNWHPFCLKCERCHSILSPGGHAEHNGRPYCHKPCYGALFGPRGVNIGGVGSYLYSPPTHTPASSTSLSPSSFSPPRPRTGLPQGKKTEKVMSLGRNWHRPCLRCQRCQKTLTAGSHAEHDGLPYCHIPCYGYLFGPKGVNIGDVGCYIYDPAEMKSK
ncbi:cysteine-rich protein 3 isoform X2 [Loxodonta africana]|uniref:cysteine-rich protein 3 isoform X2 n=1 Tax=Loxodonta africana TaxID=9785 RepID=UPI000C8112ED|nr:cysteine-rich protein 3 isoform X2 [Loxodonta africana]